VTDGLQPSLRYSEILGRNISAARGRSQLSQSAVAARMRALGFDWKQQTAAATEKAKRRVTAEELLGLAEALEVSIPVLTSAAGYDGFVELPNGMKLGAVTVERLAGKGVNDHFVMWPEGGNNPWVAVLTGPHGEPVDRQSGGDPFDLPAARAQGWPGIAEGGQPS
jgi:transcriptional regulator with XRE-family HTH domain